MNKHLSPSKIRLVSTLLAIIFALPFSWGILTGFYAWLSPFIMLNSVLLLKSFNFMNLLALLIFFDPMSLFNGFFTVFRGHVTPWEIVVFSAFPVLLALNFFLPGIWCSRLCPLGGLQNLSYSIRQAFPRMSSEE